MERVNRFSKEYKTTKYKQQKVQQKLLIKTGVSTPYNDEVRFRNTK